jgi:hypothetical protein
VLLALPGGRCRDEQGRTRHVVLAGDNVVRALNNVMPQGKRASVNSTMNYCTSPSERSLDRPIGCELHNRTQAGLSSRRGCPRLADVPRRPPWPACSGPACLAASTQLRAIRPPSGPCAESNRCAAVCVAHVDGDGEFRSARRDTSASGTARHRTGFSSVANP